MPAPQDKADFRDYALALFLIVLTVGAIAVVTAALWHRDPDTALALATRHDCLRAFDAEQCRAIVEAALAHHAATAPRYLERSTCELSFGEGQCREVGSAVGGGIFVPEIAAILAARDGGDEAKGLLPLYFGPAGERGPTEGRRVYYRGRAAGVLSEATFGGASISRIVDLEGRPITSASVEKLRGR